MLKRFSIATTIAALCLVSAASAQAAVNIVSTSGSAFAFTGNQVGNQTFTIGSNYVVTCTTAKFTGTYNGTPSTTQGFNPTFGASPGRCTVNVAGSAVVATVNCGTSTNAWTLDASAGTINSSTGAVTGAGKVRLNQPCTITVPAGGGSCVVTVTGNGSATTTYNIQNNTANIHAQDRNSADTANSGSASAGGVRIIANTGPVVNFTSTGCSSLGVAASGNIGSYQGTVFIQGMKGV